MSYFFDADYYGDARHAKELEPDVARDKYVAGERRLRGVACAACSCPAAVSFACGAARRACTWR